MFLYSHYILHIFGTFLDKYLDKIQSVNNEVEFGQNGP